MLFINHGGLVSSPKAKKGNRELHIGAWTPQCRIPTQQAHVWFIRELLKGSFGLKLCINVI